MIKTKHLLLVSLLAVSTMAEAVNSKSIATVEPTGVSSSRRNECENRAGFVYAVLDMRDKGMTAEQTLSSVYARLNTVGVPTPDNSIRDLVLKIHEVTFGKDEMRKAVYDSCLTTDKE